MNVSALSVTICYIFLGFFGVLLHPDEKKAIKTAFAVHREKQEKRKQNLEFNK